MKGFEQFLATFGDITVGHVAMAIAAIVFLVLIYKKVSEYLINKHDREQKHLEHLEKAFEATEKLPEYRQQSINARTKLEGEIQEVRTAQRDLLASVNTEIQNIKKTQDAFLSRLDEIEEQNKKRERNKIRDVLLQNYRYYTSLETNPTQTWTEMESEAFWELFYDYEEAGGNGYMHTVVQPEMQRLKVVEVGAR